MLDLLPEDLTIVVAEYLPVLDLLRGFRLINKRHFRISRLPVLWIRLGRSYSIVPLPSPSTSHVLPTHIPPERTLASIAIIDDAIHRTSFSTLKVLDRQALNGDYPCAIGVVKGGEYVAVACTGALLVVDVKRGVQGVIRLSGAIGYERPFVVGTIMEALNEKLVVAFNTDDTDRLETSNELMGICVVYIIDLKSLALGSSESLRFEVVDLLRPASIRCLALSDPHSVSPATHPSSARRAKASNWRGLLALGWENQVDVHDLVKNIHIETLEVLGCVRDVTFAGETIAVIHSNPPQVTIFVPFVPVHFPPQSDKFEEPPLKYTKHRIVIPSVSSEIDFSKIGSSVQFSSTSLSSPLPQSSRSHRFGGDIGPHDNAGDTSSLIFLDGRDSAGDKLARCVISVFIKDPDVSSADQDEYLATPVANCKCSPWTSPIRFDAKFFDGSHSSSALNTSHTGLTTHTPLALESLNTNPQQLASAFITASTISSGSHHSISRLMATRGTKEVPFVHTRLGIIGGSPDVPDASDLDSDFRLELISNKLCFNPQSDDRGAVEQIASTSSVDALMAWDEYSGKIFMIVSGWSDEWEMRSTLMILGI